MNQAQKNVLVIGSVSRRHINRLRERVIVHEVGPDVVFTEPGRELLASAHGLLVTGQAPVDGRLLDAAPLLEVISLRAVGYDRVDVTECTRRGITVCNTPGVLDGAVAELTLLLILAVARKLPAVLLDGRRQSPAPVPLGQDLGGRTLGVVGLGRIGGRLAQVAAGGLGMKVLYTARSAKPSAPGRRVDLDVLLRESDVVSLHMPLTPETAGLIGHREIQLMRPGAILVNASRGGLVDEAALLRALDEGRLGGAGLDVTEREPLPVDDPLRTATNVVLTPHIGSATEQTRDAMAEMAVRNLLLGLDGEEPLARVNGSALAMRTGAL